MKFGMARSAFMGFVLCTSGWTFAQENYPTRPIKWIVPYLAGTSPDSTVRIVGDAMSKILKQPVVVENKPGAAGNLGAGLAMRAPADGYTWVYSGSPMASSMRMYKKPGFDVMKDFVHVGRIGVSELTVVTAADSGVKTLADLLATARRQPGKLTFGSGGVGSPAHMGAELILKTANVQALHVPYKGASESTNAVIGKQVDFALAITSVALPLIQSGKLSALAVSGSARHPRLPQVPTLQEAGVAMSLSSVGGLSVPAATPPAIVKIISEALQAALMSAETRARFEALGGQTAPAGSAEYTEMLRAEIGMAARLMQAANLEAQ
jgi:tripartite-type tricarboxylate transporter receptor subunit TctC